MITTKVEPLQKDLAIILNETLSRDARARVVADFAEDQLEEGQEINRRALGIVPPHDTFVDRRLNAPLESVNPDGGTIVFEFELINEVFGWIDDMLAMHSPYLTGRYARSHVFLADGVEADPHGEIRTASEYVFVNTQPYARKIERGLSSQAPDGVYQSVAALAKRRFSNVVNIRFTYRTIRTGSNVAPEQRQPAIVLKVR